MISKTEAKNLRKIIGSRHIAQICNYLNSIDESNEDGEPITDTFISRVFNGNAEHRKLEKHIWDFAEVRIKQDEEERKRRDEILERHKALENEI